MKAFRRTLLAVAKSAEFLLGAASRYVKRKLLDPVGYANGTGHDCRYTGRRASSSRSVGGNALA